jgi:hypothetical protein
MRPTQLQPRKAMSSDSPMSQAPTSSRKYLM